MVFCALTRHSTSYDFGSAASPIDFLRIVLEALLREPETMNELTNYALLELDENNVITIKHLLDDLNHDI